MTITVKNNDTNKNENIYKRDIEAKDLDLVLQLQDKIINSLEDKSLYAMTLKDEFMEFINLDSIFLGYYSEKNDLVAYGVCVNYGENEHNYAHYLDIKKEDVLKSSQIDTVAVDVSYRGNRLQEVICRELEAINSERNNKYITATVAPDNIASLNTFKRLGYEVVKEATMHGGLDRLILLKETI